jgi:tungstate transport system ATP-binding protein
MLDRADPAIGTRAVLSGPSVLPIRFEDAAYRVGTTQVLHPLDLAVHPGAPTVVIGPNGAGKSTLIRMAMGLLAPSSGRLTFAGRETAPRGSRALVFQKPVMLRRTVAENIAFALSAAERPADRATIRRLLTRVGIDQLAERSARRLSGGEQQRLALARALAREPQVLFLDEPTASLDPAATKQVEDIVAEVAASGVKIVMSTHDLGQARRLAGEIVFLVGGQLVEHAPAASFFTDPASEAARRFLAGDLVI